MIRQFTIAALTTLGVLWSRLALAQGYGDHPHMWDYGWGMMIVGPLMMLLLVAAVVVVVVLLVRWLGGGPARTAGDAGQGRALDILRERFARGEIDKEEFEERRRLLAD